MPFSRSSNVKSTQGSSKPSATAEKGKSRRGLWMDIAVISLRLLIGATFILSGFAKSIDPWGSVYKIGEYLAVWDWHFSHGMIVTAAFGLSIVEFTAGVMLLLGCYRRFSVITMLLLMCGMLPLSLYIYLEDPVADCGCFGDLWVISNGATFLKNIVITAALIFLLLYNKRVRPAVSPYVQWLPGVLTVVYILMIGMEGYTVQPLLDFRQFKAGTPLEAGASESDEGQDFVFVYEKDGRTASFGIDNLPDSTWTYVDRRPAGRGSRKLRDDFAIFSPEGEDIAQDVIEEDGPELLVLIPTLANADISYTYYLNEIARKFAQHNIPVIGIIGGDGEDVKIWKDIAMAEYPVYTADPLQIKELVRGNMGLVMLRDGVIQWKRTASSVLDPLSASDADPMEIIEAPLKAPSLLRWLTTLYAILMGVVIAVNNGILAAIALWRRRIRKRLDVRHAFLKADSEENPSPRSEENGK